MREVSTFNQQSNIYRKRQNIPFKGPLDGAIPQFFMAMDTNAMLNSVTIDVCAMTLPRSYIDAKKRNKYAGCETFFREMAGLITQCLSAGVVAFGIATIYTKLNNKIPIRANIWATNSTIDTLHQAWKNSNNDVDGYVDQVLNNMSGVRGREISSWKNVDLETRKAVSKELSDLIKNNEAKNPEIKKSFNNLEKRISDALHVSKSVDVAIERTQKDTNGKIIIEKFSAELRNLIRDTHDLGKDIFNNHRFIPDIDKACDKLKSMNTTKSLLAVGLISCVGFGVQYINRSITRKRTGKDGFVGYENFEKDSSKASNNVEKPNKLRLNIFKTIASFGMIGMTLAVMKVKNPSEFIKRLEFTGFPTSGNAIKTLYCATLVGRFLASRDDNELRETSFRDYLGFLNWLVLGSFVSKGAAQILFDHKNEHLFNIKKGEDKVNIVRNWLENISLKSHAEIVSEGGKEMEKNIGRLNIAHGIGLLYSFVTLGCAVPLINIIMTKYNHSHKDTAITAQDNSRTENIFAAKTTGI